MIDFTSLYTNYTYTGHWDKADANAAMIVALVTTIKKERNMISPKVPKTSGAPSDGSSGLEIWKFENVGNFKTVDGVKHLFCTYHHHKVIKGTS